MYLPHGGGPCFFMEWTMGPPDTWDRLAAWLRRLPDLLPAPPRALLVVSAHWEEAVPTVSLAAHPDLIYDYYGFPPHTYELTWPAPGAPEVAERAAELLAGAGFGVATTERGYDHGVFVPLKVAWPDADVRVATLSLRRDLDPAAHLEMGAALEPLRDEGIVVIGSGMSWHNLAAFGSPAATEPSRRFDAWLAETVASPPPERRQRLAHWTDAPAARLAHPREEHLLPLMVAAGAAGADPGRIAFSDEPMGARISAAVFA
ncbi:MAG: dioxygenase [Actinomyces sp.]|nr:MAG: dioxygenase [Actinomyces sp.]